MICNRCNNRNPMNSRFCRFCGAKLDEPGAARPVADEEFLIPKEGKVDHARVLQLLDQAFAHSERGDLGAAVTLCKEALILDPRSVSAHSLLGLLYERLGQKDKAIAEYERVLQLNPESALERENLARLKGEQELERSERSAAPPLPDLRRFPYVDTMPVVFAATLAILIIVFAQRFATNASPPVPEDEPPVTMVRSDDLLSQARRALSAGNYTEAQRLINEALRQDPHSPDALELWNRLRAMMQPPPGTLITQNMGNRGLSLPPRSEGNVNPPKSQKASGSSQTPPRVPPVVPQVSIRPRGSVQADSGGIVVLPPLREPPRRNMRGGGPAPITMIEPDNSRPLPPPTIQRPRESGTEGTIVIRPGQAPPTPPREDGRELERRANQQLAQGNLEGAAELYGKAAEADHDNPGFAHQLAGAQYMKQGDYASALDEFNKAITAYKEQQGKGDPRAQKGIQACQRYIQICQSRLGNR